MDVFISWSGPRARQLAEDLRGWLKCVVQAVDPWVSSEDIAKGQPWFKEIAGKLDKCKVGIICLTPENQSEPWVLFEAGALSKCVGETHMCPYLLGLGQADITGPLAQFQLTVAEKEDTLKMLSTINASLPEGRRLDETAVNKTFNKFWPDLDSTIQRLLKEAPAGVDQGRRPQHEILLEVLEIVRGLRREGRKTLPHQGLAGGSTLLDLTGSTAGSVSEPKPPSKLADVESSERVLAGLRTYLEAQARILGGAPDASSEPPNDAK